MRFHPCAKCGKRALNETCRDCRQAVRAATARAARRAELDRLPIPMHMPTRTPDEDAEAAARVTELREAAGELRRLSAAATESLRRHLDRRGASPL